VIAESDRWFFTLLNILNSKVEDKDSLNTMEINYYASRPLKHHPNLFMASDDEGIIITSRKPKAKVVTERWLQKYGITLPLIFSDHDDMIDWSNYDEASVIAGKYKAEIIRTSNVDIHFDNNPHIVSVIRKLLPNVKVVLIGCGEEITKEK
jgi:hypothetical protein